MCFPQDNTASQIAQQQRADEVARQQRIAQGMTSINNTFDNPTTGFTDKFYAGQKQAYMDYASPQIDHQYENAKNSEVYALSRSGLLDSTAGQRENSELSLTNDQARMDTANQAQNFENSARSNVENTRSNLVSQLNATGDNAAASAAAVRQAQNLYQPVGFSPLGNAFATFSQGLSAIGSNSGNNYQGFFNQSPSLFSSGGNASTLVH
jgi:hypothetical protein